MGIEVVGFGIGDVGWRGKRMKDGVRQCRMGRRIVLVTCVDCVRCTRREDLQAGTLGIPVQRYLATCFKVGVAVAGSTYTNVQMYR